jgi:DNA-binding transcriptional MerR regulator
MRELLSVSQVALRVGRSAATVRLWALRGVLPVAAKTPSGQRLFDPGSVERFLTARAVPDRSATRS